MPEWEPYKIWGNLQDALKLETVRHIVHVPPARRIIEDEKITAGLVYDESKLNRSRLSVSWVSANTWGLGSIYGTVEFQFDWRTLVAGKNIYWVEAMTKYNPTAYRFLLTQRNLVSDIVQLYNPVTDDGPLRQAGDQWYWNGSYTSEFMIDSDLGLDRLTGLRFVQHNEQYCRLFGADCLDRQQQPSVHRTGGRILAYLLGHGLHLLDAHLKPTSNDPRNRFDLLDTAFSGLRSDLTGAGGHIRSLADSKKVMRGALALYGMDQLDSARNLLSLLASADERYLALIEIVREHLAAPEWLPEA